MNMPKNRSCARLLVVLTSILGLGTSYAGSPSFVEGTIPFAYKGEIYQTYFKVFGDLATRVRPPLVILHGGPGLSHDYLLPVSNLSNKASIPVIFYDQIGNARSTHLRDKPPSFFTIDLFIDELQNLLTHFAIQDSFDLLGHSWGGILASEFEVERHPEGLRHIIISDSLASMSLWQESNMQLLQAFPKSVQEGMAAGMKDPAAYQAALRQFHAVHGCRVQPTPPEFVYSLEQVFGANGDPTVASSPMLDGWSIIGRLGAVRKSALIINGRYDISQDFVIAPFFQEIPEAKWITFENSSHTPFWEERERYMEVVERFLSGSG
ncbi:hypothetical protein ACG7TL_002856 [Trametes sanguinea]